jgi:hypothetical protein
MSNTILHENQAATQIAWPDSPPDSLERAFLYFKLPLSVLILVRAILRSGVAEKTWTINELVDASNLGKAQIRNGLEQDAGLFIGKLPAIKDSYLKDMNKNEPQSTGNFPTNLTGSQNPGGRSPDVFYLRRMHESIPDLLKVIAVKLSAELWPNTDAPATPELLSALGCNDPIAQVQISLRTQGGDQAPLEQYQAELERWQKALTDLTCTPLPDDVVVTNGAQYRAAIVKRIAVQGKQFSRPKLAALTGISERSIDSACRRAGAVREQRTADQIVTSSQELPAPAYSNKFHGFPAKITAEGCKPIPYVVNGMVNPEAKELMVSAQKRGAKVKVIFQQASLLRMMTPQEREVSAALKAEKKVPTKRTTACHATHAPSLRDIAHDIAREWAEGWCFWLNLPTADSDGVIFSDAQLIDQLRGKPSVQAKYPSKSVASPVPMQAPNPAPQKIIVPVDDPALDNDPVIAGMRRSGGVVTSVENTVEWRAA